MIDSKLLSYTIQNNSTRGLNLNEDEGRERSTPG